MLYAYVQLYRHKVKRNMKIGLGFHESKNNKMIYMNEPIGP